MTTKAQNATEQQCGALAGMTQADAGQARPILGNSHAVCRVIVEKLFGKRHWAAGWALDMCDADSQFLTHLAEQPRGYVHFLCLIRLALLARGGGYGEAQDVARLLRAGNEWALLEEFFPSCPADIIGVLHKLPKKPFHKGGYRMLISALEDESMRSHLSQSKRVSEATICFFSSIANIPARFRPAAMRLFNIDYQDAFENYSADYFSFLQVIRTIEKFNLKVTDQEFNEAVNKAGSAFPGGVRDLRDWIRKKVSKLPFPPPPWEGNDKIRPIRSPDEWEKAAAKFNFALKSSTFYDDIYVSRIVTGHDYIYVCEHIPAMIIIRRGTDEEWCLTGWAILDIRGEKNRRIGLLQEHELRQVFHQFLDASIYPDPFYFEVHSCH